jgi:tetratricopeptide (TPR) repeat protein
LEYYAAYESAACRFRAGQVEQARAEFIRLVRDDLERGSLPYADSRLRTALFDEKSADNAWTKLLRDVVKRLIETKRRGEAVAVAYQAWQLGDAVLAEELVDLAVHGVTDREELFEATLAAIDFHWAMGKTSRAETLLDLLLEDEVLCRSPYLWRLSAGLASRRENGQVGLARLEKAIELEFRQVVPVVDLDQVRQDYQGLLLRYHRLASAMKTLGVEPPADFPARIVRAADRWRSLDRDNVEPCNLAARTLRVLEVTDLAWDYMTTPVAMQPAESDPWLAMASQLASEGDVNLADRAYVAAYQAEPTNAQILWDRAQLLERARRTEDARKVYRQIADGKWQPRFTWIQGQAKARLAR